MKYSSQTKHSWTLEESLEIFNMPFNDLLFEAQSITRANFDPNAVQVSTLCNIKTGGCPEDCKYCPQSAKYNTGLGAEKLIGINEVKKQAQAAKDAGSTRFCMGAAWRSPKQRDMAVLTEMVSEVKGLGLETCMTLGMIDESQAHELKDAGLDYYNHNLDSSEEFYSEIITTRGYQDRLDTLDNVAKAGLNTCCGGIVGMGEKLDDRAKMLVTLANMETQPKSVPINQLVKVEGTPLDGVDDVDSFDFIRTIATARIMLPKSYVRLSAGREEMNEETQALCFFAGANSIFYGEELLTTPNPSTNSDKELMDKLGLKAA